MPNESLNSVIWENLEYKDYFVASATKDARKGTMVSVGIASFVYVVDDQWSGH